MRIVYDTEFIDDGMTITPISIAMRREDGAELYAITDSLATIARSAENPWLIERVLKWLPIELTWTDLGGRLNANVTWDADHPEYEHVRALDEIAEMVEDFVLAKSNPQLWSYYAAYDHVLYAQLFGAMIELPDGMPKYTMDIKQLAVSLGDPRMPLLPQSVVDSRFNGVRCEHHALYDVYEEEYRLLWLRNLERGRTDPYAV